MEEHGAGAHARKAPGPSGPGPGAAMFQHLGLTLALLRSVRGLSQARVASKSGLGKSQLSKYERGKELPKLESLSRLLQTLGVSLLELSYTLALVQQQAARMAAGSPHPAIEGAALLLVRPRLLARSLDEAMRKLVEDLFILHRGCLEAALFRETS